MSREVERRTSLKFKIFSEIIGIKGLNPIKYFIDVKNLYYQSTTQLMLLNNQVYIKKFNFIG